MNRTSRAANSSGLNKDGARQGKTFACKHDGCGKKFTRLEHLNRHSLNHTAGNATCPRCRAHFKRPDLLARHMDRHKQKDDENGGNGVLQTRKRAWKDVDGTIVDKRPTVSDDLEPEEAAQDTVTVDVSYLAAGVERPISPPASHESSDFSSHQISDYDFIADFQGEVLPQSISSVSSGYIPLAENTGAGSDFWNSSLGAPAWGTQNSLDLPQDDLFQADTASSFNMPFTTANNYSWLFDMNFGMVNNPADAQQQQEQPFFTQDLPAADQMCLVDDQNPGSQTSLPPQMESPFIMKETDSDKSRPGVLNQHSQTNSSDDTITTSAYSNTNSDLNKLLQQQLKATSLDPVEIERPLSSVQHSLSLPCIDECTREEILELVESLRPVSPDDDVFSRDSKLLSLSSLQAYLDLFFTRFNTAYPLIHQATFVASETNTLLLLAMLLLGATYSSKGAHQLAVCIHDVMRPAIFSNAGFSARPELWVLETILLVECFGKSRAGQKQHDMSHLFHGLLINLIRRSDCQTVQPLGPDEVENTSDDLEVVWRRWAEAEQKKRLALLCFLWDTQHAVLFCQSLCMSSFELRLTLPCSQSLWEAPTASDWMRHAPSYTREPQFLSTLKSYLTPSAPRPPRLNSLSRVLILHGLMSVFWDMQRRDQTSLGVIPGENGSLSTWKDRISQAYDLWKVDFDAHCMAVASHFREQDLSGENYMVRHAQHELSVFATSYKAVYHAAQVLLNSSFLDLQIYAGARHILGKPVQRTDYVRSERVIKRWASYDNSSNGSSSAAKAAWHAAQLLRDASQNLEDFDAMGLFHVPWCLYLATLTCWAFHHSAPGRGESSNLDGEMVWDAKAEMEMLISGMADSETPQGVISGQGRVRTGGMVWVMANILERVRWGVVHAGVVVMRGIVPWRLINQYQAF